jgi:ribonuclease Z
MTEIYFLGTGGAVATKERDNMSFLVDHDETLILVDCPGNVIQKIKKLNYDPRKVTLILVTHIHPDHIYGLPSFVHSLMLDRCLIRLFGSKEAVQFCQDLLDLFHLRDEKIKAKIEFVSLNPGENFELNDSLQCVSYKVPHSSSSLAYRFRFEEEKKELLYSGDTPLNPLLFKEASGVDYLIHDCSAPSRFFKKYPSLHTVHTHSLELGKLSQQAKIKCLIPCHFFGELGFPLSEIEDEIRKNYKGRLVIPEDLKKITL